MLFSFWPKFEMYEGGEYAGHISKEPALFRQKYDIDCRGWSVSGDVFGCDYEINDSKEELIARISKKLLKVTDTYVIDVIYSENALGVLMTALALDAVKCSDN